MIRWNLQRGALTEWKRGCDHAGLATHEKIEAALLADGKDPLNSSDYAAAAHQWEQNAKRSIFDRFAILGCAFDPEEPRYTLDDGCRQASDAAFRLLDAQGYITRGPDGHLLLDLSCQYEHLATAIRSGQIQILPETHAARLIQMLEKKIPWNLTRDIPWGIQHPDREDGWAPKTLDTWFSSSLWTLALRGWDGSEASSRFDLEYSILETGYDILFFWCARMLAISDALGLPYPFSKIYLHGLMRDAKGRKFSKSLGNGIDPAEICQSHGADALRLYLCFSTLPGTDAKFSPTALNEWSRLLRKLHNAGRLIEQHRPPGAYWTSADFGEGPLAHALRLRMEPLMEHQDFREALSDWKRTFLSFCRYELERSKGSLSNDETWTSIAGEFCCLLALLHPFAPHATWAWASLLGEPAPS